MLFQNSCDVPLGMTAMVSFFPAPAPFGPERLQPKTATAMQTANIEIILRIVCLSFIFVFRITPSCPQLQPDLPPGCLGFRALRFQLPSCRHLFRNTGGLRANPTPDGVPVAITSPGSRVIVSERKDTSCGIP